ncbi:hypothetical protein M1N92_06930, partial [Dehalococcoidia bacterium]|nr:hypothetical protein [Dehalococcoidia bacterium]
DFPQQGGIPMDSITKRYGLANFDDFSITGFLVPTGHYAQEIGLIDLFKEHLKIDMKTVHHTPVEKVIELFVSMIAGCPDVKTVNTTLLIYPPVVSYKGVENLEGGHDENGCWQPTIAGAGRVLVSLHVLLSAS